MSTDIKVTLPLTYAAQQRLERTKAEIIKFHGEKYYPAELGTVQLSNSQALDLRSEQLPAIDIDISSNAITTTIVKSENTHNGTLAVSKDCHDALSSGFDRFERGLDRVENQPEAVERRLGSLEKKVDEYAPNMYRIVNNSGARQFNSHARKKTSTLEPLLTVRFDENRRASYPVPPGFPQSVARENSPPSHAAADHQELDSEYTIMDLRTFEEVRDYPEECFETFVTWIGVKMKVVEALMDS